MVWSVMFLDTPGKIMEIKEALGENSWRKNCLEHPVILEQWGGENKIFKLNPKVENFNASWEGIM